MAKRPRAVRIVRDRASETITVYLPCRDNFPYSRHFALLPNIVNVEVVSTTDDKLNFKLTLRASNKPACREQLNRILPVKVISDILNGRADCIISMSYQTTVKAVAALEQIAKFSQRQQHILPTVPTSVPVIPGAVGRTITQQRDAQHVLLSLADKNGRIPAGSLPQPHPRRSATTG